MQFLEILLDLAVYLLAGIASSYYFYEKKRRDLLGGFWGGAFIGTIGAVLISMLTGIEAWFIRFATWLMQPKIGDDLVVRVNLITALLGGLLFVFILNKINHDRERRN